MHITYDIAPTPGHPRNSEGAFLPLADGRILFIYSAFSGESARDHTPADLAAITSKDGGRTWSAPRTVVRAGEYDAMNVMSVSLLRMRDGAVGLFFLIRRSWSDMCVALRRSYDEGETFGPETRCSPRVGYFVMNNDRVVRLSTGRILAPAAEHVCTPDGAGGIHLSPATATCFFSDDDGVTWREADAPVALSGTPSRSGLQEPGLIELHGGTVFGWARTDLCMQYAFHSHDGGQRFTAPAPSGFTSPLSPLSMKRLPDGRLLAVWNPIPEYQTRRSDWRTAGRTPLVYALSRDEGRTWSEPEVLEDDPKAGYCYTAIAAIDGALLLAYCAGQAEQDGLYLNRTRIRRIPMGELKG